MIKTYVAAVAILAATTLSAQTKKPFVEPGTENSTAETSIGPNDQWIRAAIDIDKKGYPTKCRVIESNIRNSERRFWFCNAMMRDWHAAPILKDGVPVASTVTRRMVLHGK